MPEVGSSTDIDQAYANTIEEARQRHEEGEAQAQRMEVRTGYSQQLPTLRSMAWQIVASTAWPKPSIHARSSAEYQVFLDICVTRLPLRVADLSITAGSDRGWLAGDIMQNA